MLTRNPHCKKSSPHKF